MLLDEGDNIKLCDFAGSSIDGSKPMVYNETRGRIPRRDVTDELTDIFALGSAIYELITTRVPYEDKLDWEVKALYIKGVFPTLPDGQAYEQVASIFWVARSCWQLHVESAEEVVGLLGSREKARSRTCGLPTVLMSIMKEMVILPTLAWMKQKP